MLMSLTQNQMSSVSSLESTLSASASASVGAPVASSTTNASSHRSMPNSNLNVASTKLFNTPNPIRDLGKPNNIITSNHANVSVPQSTNSTPEFLYQLTKMLTSNHRDIIEWSQGTIKVHDPIKLETDILQQYFRHSKYASFQRQLNYFGFRKLAGKGKMAPCSYINDAATDDVSCILAMKRKAGGTQKDGNHNDTDDDVLRHPDAPSMSHSHPAKTKPSSSTKMKHHKSNSCPNKRLKHLKPTDTVNKLHHLNNNKFSTSFSSATTKSSSSSSNTVNNPLLNTTSSPSSNKPKQTFDPIAIAKAAVGRGVKHQFSSKYNQGQGPKTLQSYTSSQDISAQDLEAWNFLQQPSSSFSNNNNNYNNNQDVFTFLDPSQLGMDIHTNVNELRSNFQNSLNNDNILANSSNNISSNDDSTVVSSYYPRQYQLRRDSSLIDLAIIPMLDSADSNAYDNAKRSMNGASSVTTNYDSCGMTFIDFPDSYFNPEANKNDGNHEK